MKDLQRSLLYTIRTLAAHPGGSAAAILALGLGIGLATTVFSIAFGVVVRGLPFKESDRILLIETADPAGGREGLEVFPGDFLDFRSRQRSFEGLAAFYLGTVNLSGDGVPERRDGAFITAGGFEILGIRPALGRGILPADEIPPADPVVVLSDRLWQARYAGDPHVLGRAILVNGRQATIVGVMPKKFAFPLRQDLWVPLQLDATAGREAGRALTVFGRLRQGVTREAAQSEMTGILRAVEKENPEGHQGYLGVLIPYTKKFLGPEVSSLLLVMLAFGLAVLLIASVNVALLMLARASGRTQELAIRLSLGARRRQIAFQLLGESGLLAIAGATLGLGLAALGVHLFNTAIYGHVASEPPFWIHIAIDRFSLAFTLAATGLSALLSGLLPALRVSRLNVNALLKRTSQGRSSLRLGWLSRATVIGELAFCCMLMIGAGLMLKSIVKLQRVDLGFKARNLLTARVSLTSPRYRTAADRLRFYEALIHQLESRPGITAAALTTALPTNGSSRGPVLAAGSAVRDDRELPTAFMAAISPNYFRALGARLLAGRDFGLPDRPDSLPVCIVNTTFARETWPRGDALGRRIRVGKGADPLWRTVVGIAPDLAMRALQDSQSGPAGIYTPIGQEVPTSASILLKTHGDPLTHVPALRTSVYSLDRDLPVYFVQSMGQLLASNTFFYGLFASIFAILGGCALVLAVVGIYGVIAFSVEQQKQEIGVRISLGANHMNIFRLMLRQSSLQLGLGLGAGLLLAHFSSGPLRALLFAVPPSDPMTYVAVSLVLAATGLAAFLWPTRRTLQLAPWAALRP